MEEEEQERKRRRKKRRKGRMRGMRKLNDSFLTEILGIARWPLSEQP